MTQADREREREDGFSSTCLCLCYSFSSKLRREELEHLRREVDQLKARLSETQAHTHSALCFLSPRHRLCGAAHVWSFCEAEASVDLSTTSALCVAADREAGGGRVPPAGRGQGDQEAV